MLRVRLAWYELSIGRQLPGWGGGQKASVRAQHGLLEENGAHMRFRTWRASTTFKLR